jgi:hypothetical protein
VTSCLSGTRSNQLSYGPRNQFHRLRQEKGERGWELATGCHVPPRERDPSASASEEALNYS